MRQVARIIEAVGLLCSAGGVTIRRLEDSLGVSRRAGYRTLDALQAMGVPLYEEPAASGRERLWKLDDRYVDHLPTMDVPRIRLSEEERLLLAFLPAGPGVFQETAIAAPLASLRQKASAMRGVRSFDSAAMDGLISPFIRSGHLSKSYAGKEDLVEDLAKAILDRMNCITVYHALSTGRVYQFRIDPLRLVEHCGGISSMSASVK